MNIKEIAADVFDEIMARDDVIKLTEERLSRPRRGDDDTHYYETLERVAAEIVIAMQVSH